MSCNLFVGLTDENRVFFSGRHRHLNLRELNMPKTENKKIVSVGSSFNTYYIMMEDDSFYSNSRIPNFESNMYYGKEKLYKYQSETSSKPMGFKVSGKYDSIIGSAHA
jgi:hypothetical protein